MLETTSFRWINFFHVHWVIRTYHFDLFYIIRAAKSSHSKTLMCQPKSIVHWIKQKLSVCEIFLQLINISTFNVLCIVPFNLWYSCKWDSLNNASQVYVYLTVIIEKLKNI